MAQARTDLVPTTTQKKVTKVWAHVPNAPTTSPTVPLYAYRLTLQVAYSMFVSFRTENKLFGAGFRKFSRIVSCLTLMFFIRQSKECMRRRSWVGTRVCILFASFLLRYYQNLTFFVSWFGPSGLDTGLIWHANRQCSHFCVRTLLGSFNSNPQHLFCLIHILYINSGSFARNHQHSACRKRQGRVGSTSFVCICRHGYEMGYVSASILKRLLILFFGLGSMLAHRQGNMAPSTMCCLVYFGKTSTFSPRFVPC